MHMLLLSDYYWLCLQENCLECYHISVHATSDQGIEFATCYLSIYIYCILLPMFRVYDILEFGWSIFLNVDR